MSFFRAFEDAEDHAEEVQGEQAIDQTVAAAAAQQQGGQPAEVCGCI